MYLPAFHVFDEDNAQRHTNARKQRFNITIPTDEIRNSRAKAISSVFIDTMAAV